MKVLTGNNVDGWTLNVTDIEFRMIASTFKELMIQSLTDPEEVKSSMAAFACSVYNEMVNARGGIDDVVVE